MATTLKNFIRNKVAARNTREKTRLDGTGHVFKTSLRALTYVTVLFILLIFLLAPCDKFVIVVTYLAVASACFVGGAALGLLFGLPRSEKFRFNKKDETDHNTSENFYSDNANLEEISDWLTKIIIGISLLNIRTILKWIDQSARSISNSFDYGCNGSLCNYYSFAYGILIFYFLAGAGICFLWARTSLSLLLTKSKRLQLNLQNEQLLAAVQTLANSNLNERLDVMTDGGAHRSLKQEKGYQPSDVFRRITEEIYNAKPIYDASDIQKNRWGGKARVNEKILEAKYDPATSWLGLHKVILRVRTLDPDRPLTGDVAFFLHDTFPNQIVYVKPENNLAEFELNAWEAFIVGARTEDGSELELDLNTVPGFPQEFYWHE